jgi:hypothetical protein
MAWIDLVAYLSLLCRERKNKRYWANTSKQIETGKNERLRERGREGESRLIFAGVELIAKKLK